MEKQYSTKQIYFFIYVILVNIIFLSTTESLKAEECLENVVDFDIVYVRMPRRGDLDNSIKWPEVENPARVEPGSDLILLHPDCSEEILYDAGLGAVTDPFVSFDGKKVLFSYFPDAEDLTRLDSSSRKVPVKGSDIYSINLETKQVTQLTHQKFTPNTGAGLWNCTGSNELTECNPMGSTASTHNVGQGIFNLGPAPIAGGKIIFTSSRNGFDPTKSFTRLNLQLFVMDEDGSNVTAIAPMTIGSALHPTPLKNGQVMFSSYESQGLRDQRLWGVWSINPDGRQWKPVISSFMREQAFHFSTQLSNGDIIVEDYYNFNNFGFGALHKIPTVAANIPAFYNAFANEPENTPIIYTRPSAPYNASRDQYPGFTFEKKLPFAPKGIESITPFTLGADYSAPIGEDGERVGKFTHPSAVPNNHLLVVWSPGPVNDVSGGRPMNIPAVDAGIYLIKEGKVITSPADSNFISIKNDPEFNEVWPRAVVSYQDVHGQPEPDFIEWLPDNEKYPDSLPSGSPYGLIGTSSFYNRESFPGFARTNNFDGLDSFNVGAGIQEPSNDSSNWIYQGSDAGKYTNADIWAVRIVAQEANTRRRFGPHNQNGTGQTQHFYNHANEKLRILGEISLRKFNTNGTPLLDSKGDPDTSFLAKIPADTPFTFQMLDRNGMVLTNSQTWHQIRPGEVRADCGGCHAHSQTPVMFDDTAAAKPDYLIQDLSKSTPLLTRTSSEQNNPEIKTINSNVVNVEFYKDIRPILDNHCVQCHQGESAAGNLDLNDRALYSVEGVYFEDKIPGDYKRLCNDPNASWGHKPIAGFASDQSKPVWNFPNASRYVRKFQSRRSLLAWKVFGERLDGWTNEDHPTETIPGDLSSYPEGTSHEARNKADLDYTGSMMPPPGNSAGAEPLTEDQKMAVARWIDLGCPIDTAQQQSTHVDFGWYLDDQRPVLHISQPKAGDNPEPLEMIRIGVADAYKGIQTNSLKITASIEINGRAAGADLTDLAQQTDDGIYTLNLTPPLQNVTDAHLYVQVADNQTEINDRFNTDMRGNITRVDRKFSVANNSQDTDDDGVSDSEDNCTLVANELQRDTDGDGFGNQCDADLDNNGIVGVSDLSIFRSRFGSTNQDADFNGNGRVSFGDLNIFRQLFGHAPGPSQRP